MSDNLIAQYQQIMAKIDEANATLVELKRQARHLSEQMPRIYYVASGSGAPPMTPNILCVGTHAECVAFIEETEWLGWKKSSDKYDLDMHQLANANNTWKAGEAVPGHLEYVTPVDDTWEYFSTRLSNTITESASDE